MAGAKITVDYKDNQVQEVLGRLLDVTTNTEPVMAEIAEYFHERTRDHFDNEEDPYGKPWAPLAKSTKQRRAKMGVPVNKILHGQTLNLRDTIFPFYSRDEAGVSTGPGTKAYAAIQQFGGRTGRNRSAEIPARGFLGIGPQDEQEVLDILEEEILGAG